MLGPKKKIFYISRDFKKGLEADLILTRMALEFSESTQEAIRQLTLREIKRNLNFCNQPHC